jgi:hypothetical protein
MPTVTDFLNHNVMKLLLEDILNLMKISCLVSLVRHLAFVPSSTYDPSSAFVPSIVPILVSYSLDDDSEDENPPSLAHLPPKEYIDHEPKLTPPLPRWVSSIREVIGDLFSDPLYQHQTCS